MWANSFWQKGDQWFLGDDVRLESRITKDVRTHRLMNIFPILIAVVMVSWCIFMSNYQIVYLCQLCIILWIHTYVQFLKDSNSRGWKIRIWSLTASVDGKPSTDLLWYPAPAGYLNYLVHLSYLLCKKELTTKHASGDHMRDSVG